MGFLQPQIQERRPSSSSDFIISSLLCQIPRGAVDVFQPFGMMEELARPWWIHKMSSSRECLLWFREVQFPFPAPFLLPPSHFVASLVFSGSSWDQKQEGGVGRMDISAGQGKMGFFWEISVNPFPTKSKPGMSRSKGCFP